MNPPCQKCGKLVYPMEKLKCLDLYWHKPCFKCEVCNMTLNLKNYKGYDKKPYCQAHYPQTKFTTVAETPEMQRLKQLSEQQSQALYHKQFEEERGRYTAVADDPEMERLKKNTQQISSVKYHADFERQKGQKLSVDTDPEIERTKRNMATISNAEYHNLKQTRNEQEKRRPSDAEQYSHMPHLLQDTTSERGRHYSYDAGQPSYVGSLPRQKVSDAGQPSFVGSLPRQKTTDQSYERRGSNNSDDSFKRPADVPSSSGSTSKPIGSIFDKEDPLAEDEYYQKQMRDKQRRASYQRKEKQLHGFGFVAQPQPVKQASVSDSNSRNSSYQDEPAPQTHKVGSVHDLDPVRNEYRHSSGNQYGGQPQYTVQAPQQHAPQHQPQHAPQHQQQHAPQHQPHVPQQQGRGDDDVFAPNPRRLSSGPRSAGLTHISVSDTPADTTSPKISSPVSSALPPMPMGPRYQALYDYTAGDDDEVSFMEGDIVIDTETIDQGWMTGRVERTGKSGMLPSNYVERIG